jgi:hypothetical protein
MGTLHRNALDYGNLVGFLIDSKKRKGVVTVEPVVKIFYVMGNTENLPAVGRSTVRQTIHFVDGKVRTIFGITEGTVAGFV